MPFSLFDFFIYSKEMRLVGVDFRWRRTASAMWTTQLFADSGDIVRNR